MDHLHISTSKIYFLQRSSQIFMANASVLNKNHEQATVLLGVTSDNISHSASLTSTLPCSNSNSLMLLRTLKNPIKLSTYNKNNEFFIIITLSANALPGILSETFNVTTSHQLQPGLGTIQPESGPY